MMNLRHSDRRHSPCALTRRSAVLLLAPAFAVAAVVSRPGLSPAAAARADAPAAAPAERTEANLGDIADVLTLARHVAPDGIQISVLVGYGIEGKAIDAAADHLPVLGREALDRLAERIEKLPPGTSAKDSVRIEREFGQQWVLRKVREMQNDPDFVKHFVIIIGPQEGDHPIDIEGAVRAAGGTADTVARR